MPTFFRRLWHGLPAASDSYPRPLLLVVEGNHDAEFLKRLSAILHRQNHDYPDLRQAELSGEVLFVPAGGGNVGNWTLGLCVLGMREFHVYDREMCPETLLRAQLVATINARPRSAARLTSKRGLENYLHPEAIQEAAHIRIEVTDDASVADLAARAVHETLHHDVSWNALSTRAHKRARNRAKRWLNTRAVDCMNASRLEERDPEGEITGWLELITRLLGSR